MLLKDCSIEQLLQQKEQHEKIMEQHVSDNDEIMIPLDKERMAEINRCIEAKRMNLSDVKNQSDIVLDVLPFVSYGFNSACF